MKKIVGIVLAVVLVIGGGGMYYLNSRAPQVMAQEDLLAMENKYQEYHNDELIISALRAKELLDTKDNVVVVDVRNAAEYALGHIEGSVNVWRPDYSADDNEYEYGGMRSTREKMGELLGSLGIDKDTTIIVSSHDKNHDGARFVWQLKMFGHENVLLLDGGIVGWQAAGLPTTLARTQVTPTEFKFTNEIDESQLATLEDVKAALEDPNVIILDTRGYDEFTGENLLSGAFRAGRIPGSIWVEYIEALNSDVDATFKSYDELKELFESNGVTKDKTVIAYCQSGVRSALSTFVLSELLGYENVMNYDGSWIEWSYYEELPIEIGEL